MSCPQLWGLGRDLHVLPGVLFGRHKSGICRQGMSAPHTDCSLFAEQGKFESALERSATPPAGAASAGTLILDTPLPKQALRACC